MTEKLILMHENTPYFNFFPFFETFRGAVAPPAPLWRRRCVGQYQHTLKLLFMKSYIVY